MYQWLAVSDVMPFRFVTVLLCIILELCTWYMKKCEIIYNIYDFLYYVIIYYIIVTYNVCIFYFHRMYHHNWYEMLWQTTVKMSYRKLLKLLVYRHYKHTFPLKTKHVRKKVNDNICPSCSKNYTGETEITSVVCNVLINQEGEYKELTLFTPQVEEITEKPISPEKKAIEEDLSVIPVRIKYVSSPKKDNTVSKLKRYWTACFFIIQDIFFRYSIF